MGNMKPAVRCAAFAAAALGALLGAQTGAQAQAWIEIRPFAAPFYYEAPYVETYRRAPAVEADFIPRRFVRRIIERRGLEVIGPIQLTGEVYIVPVEDRRGRVDRIVVDAYTGELVERLGASAATRSLANRRAEDPPRPPREIGRPQRDALARPSPDALERPRRPAAGFDFGPESGRVPPLPPRRAIAPRPPEPAASHAARPQEADGAAAASKAAAPDVAKAVPGKPEPRKVEPPKPEPRSAGPGTPEATQPEQASKPVTKPVAEPVSTPANTQAAGEGETAARKPGEAATPKAAAEKAQSAKADGAREPGASRNGDILRRPSQTPDAEAETARTGVATGPAASTGAEPQRRAPRVVYPGPGGAPVQPPAGEGE